MYVIDPRDLADVVRIYQYRSSTERLFPWSINHQFGTAACIRSADSKIMLKIFLLITFGLVSNEIQAFCPSLSRPLSSTLLFSHVDRRLMLKSSIPISLGLSTVLARQQPAVAAGSPPSADDLSRIKQGYEKIQYLLANFEQETTVCRDSGGECKRDAEPVRKGRRMENSVSDFVQIHLC